MEQKRMRLEVEVKEFNSVMVPHTMYEAEIRAVVLPRLLWRGQADLKQTTSLEIPCFPKNIACGKSSRRPFAGTR